MLNVPQLDDLGYDRIFDRARSRIPLLTGEWTDFNHHDPGITVLQTFAWLTDTLNYYMNATGEIHRLKYLKLLGLEPGKSAAACDLSWDADGEIHLARGTRLAAGDIVFELAESRRAVGNRLTRIYNDLGGTFHDLMPFAGVDGGYARIFTYDTDVDTALYLGFARPLEGEVRFWVDVVNEPRNAFVDAFFLSELVWESCADGHWTPVSSVRDDTCGFLRDGFIELRLDTATIELENPVLAGGHYIRCRLVKNGYDVLPRIGRIAVNSIRAEQTQTYARTLELRWTGEARIPLDAYIRETDVLTVAVQDGEGYTVWYEHEADEDSLCDIAPGERPWERVLVFDRERFGTLPPDDAAILVFVADREQWEELRLGTTLGCADERLPFDAENLYSMRLALSETRGGRTYLELWEEWDDITRASWNDRAFRFDRDSREIVFGDSLMGRQPDGGLTVTAVEVKTSLLDGGNVRQGQITRFLDPVDETITITNPSAATGGQACLDSAGLEEAIEEKLNRVTRAVNAADYIALVKATPGLCIDLVTVVTMAEYSAIYGAEQKANTVMVVVKPYSEWEPRPGLSEAYRRRIRDNLEQYRLVTVNVEVVAARYVGVGVYGRIHLRDDAPAARQKVLDCLSDLIDFHQTGQFGKDVVYGNVFSHLEMLDCVAKVSQLSFEHYGEGGDKNIHGDIVVHPDALAYVYETDLEFV
ncbi:baseplate J/gp47 family protein [Ruminococcaceae bacterium OttesenSCG-928-L11]|nr:baseplate J/gp47 family protein [Ruminococcaceae bacterium OttesenSCG-928-L11]